MADPITIASLGLTALGGISGAAGAEAMGQAQFQQNQYQAGVALVNAQIAKQNEEYASQEGEQQAQKYGLGAAQRFGQIKTAQASSGFDVNSGSAKEVQQSQRTVTTIDMDQIRSNAAKTAYNYSAQVVGFENQANLYRLAGANALEAGNINAVSSVLGSASSVASKWVQGGSVGMFGSGGGVNLGFGVDSSSGGIGGY